MHRIAAMDNKQIRRINMRILVREAARNGLSLNKYCEELGVNPSYVSQFIGPKGKRDMGDDIARRIETALGQERGWLDILQLEEAHLMKCGLIYDKLLELPGSKLDSLIDILDIYEANEREGSLGRIRMDAAAITKSKGRVHTLKDK